MEYKVLGRQRSVANDGPFAEKTGRQCTTRCICKSDFDDGPYLATPGI